MARASLLVGALIVAVTLFCGFGFMSYYSLNQRYTRTAALHDQVLMQYDNSVVQIRALQAEKTRLQDQLQRDTDRLKRDFDDLLSDRKTMGEKLGEEKKALLNKIVSLEALLKRAETDYTKQSDRCALDRDKLETCSAQFDKYKLDSDHMFNEQKQECSSTISRLQGEIAQLQKDPSRSQVQANQKEAVGNHPSHDDLVNNDINQIPEPAVKTESKEPRSNQKILGGGLAGKAQLPSDINLNEHPADLIPNDRIQNDNNKPLNEAGLDQGGVGL